jgi:hypothetical protein
MANTPNVPKSNKISTKFILGIAGWAIIATAIAKDTRNGHWIARWQEPNGAERKKEFHPQGRSSALA